MGFGDRSTGMGTFWGEFGVRRYNQWELTFAATRPSSQITLGRLIIISVSSQRMIMLMFVSLRFGLRSG